MFLFLLYILFTVDHVEGCYYLYNNYFIYNNFIILIKKFIILFMLFYFILLNNFDKIYKLPIFEYLIILLICLFGLFMIISSNHLFVIFLFVELVNLCIYCLLGINKNSNKGIEAAFKYFTQSSYATIIGFFGVSLIYMGAGTLFLNELHLLILYENVN